MSATEIKKGLIEEDADQQQKQEEKHQESSSDFEDQMAIDQFLNSKETIDNPSSSSAHMKNFKSHRQSRRSGKKKIQMDNITNEVAFCSVMERAKEVQANLSGISLIKPMLHSQVTKGFFLGLPANFCKMHLPSNDGIVILEDEDGEEYQTKFLANKIGLNGGWATFAKAHNLLEGDVVVFHLVKPCKFKVYIVRSSGLSEVDGAICLLSLENHTRERDSGSFVDLQNFDIIVNDANLASRLSEACLIKYYELCHSQKSYLHDHLLKSINARLAATIIMKTVNIADTIKACEISMPKEDFALWDKTLEGFELLGMEVGFLRTRLNKLVSFVKESEEVPESKRYKEAKLEYNAAEEEIRLLETRLLTLQQVRTSLKSEVDTLNTKIRNSGSRFREEANAPW